MTDLIRRAAAWLTDTRRQALQAAIASLLTLVVALGFATGEQSAALLALAAGILQLLQGSLGLVYLTRSDTYSWLNTNGRAALYAAAAALGPVGVAFNLWGDEGTAAMVAIAGVIVTMLSAFVQVVNVQTVHTTASVTPLDLDPVTLAQVRAAYARRAGLIDTGNDERDPSTYRTERKPLAPAE
ncbi:hypothetical protein [Microbacterium sp. Bi128]|uniref:hypothetical protein n=1 Tax=Microbacterium sp. Bi128 TaxID=2821115 RepID=UPI001DE38D7E|nr:hypothetical protein [Microbacterium sp. Bi128]CAH0257989.1 hypothetical protein SRABI128_03072 [Microbacterium sp. Bi128]